MPTTSFAKAIDNIATTVATAYTAGSGKLYVASTTGITLSGGAWVRVSTARSGSPLSILKATAVGSDGGGSYLTISGAADGYTDVNLLVGDAAELRVTAGAFNDLATAVNTLESAGGGAADMLSVLVNTPVSVTGTTGLTSSAFGKMHVCSGTSSNYTVTLPSPTSNAGKFIGFRMDSGLTKLVTISHNASENIDGAASRVMWADEVAILLTDGTNWFKVSGKSVPMGCVMYMHNSGNPYSVPDSTQSPLPIDSFINNGASSVLMADTTNHRINILRPSTYFISGVNSFVSFAGNASNSQTSIWRNYSTSEEALTSAYAVSGGDRTTYTAYVTKSPVAGDTISLVAYQNSGSACNSLNTDASFVGLNNLTVTEIVSW